MNPDWDGVMKSRAREDKPPARRVRVTESPRVMALLRKLEARSVGSWDTLDRSILAELREAIEATLGVSASRPLGESPQS